MTAATRLDRLHELYPTEQATEVSDRLEARLSAEPPSPARDDWSADDVWLITYADQFRQQDRAPLATLATVLDTTLADVVNGVHVLPFYPWSSDDGFAVKDPNEVEPAYGDWADVEQLGANRPLMVDAVLNHLSSEAPWFQAFLDDEEPHRRFFRTEAPDTDTSAVVRARTHPLLTPFETAAGTRWVWTTFSADQVDLDYGEPDVLLAIVDVVLGYARRGATAIRLDAVGFCWKDPATPSIHQPETHAIVQLIADCLEATHPGVYLITETNVPHEENISYLNRERREAQGVYQFPLAPLVAHAARTGDVGPFIEWAQRIDEVVAPGRSFLNFLACHDGIGLRPAEGLLTAEQVDGLVGAARRSGGTTTDRALPGGGRSAYELNVTWFDLMGEGVDEETAIARHLATHALMLALPGVAGVYVHSLFGSRNDGAGMEASGIARRINRARFDLDDIEGRLADPASIEARVLAGIRTHVAARRASPVFHPAGGCEVDEPAAGVIRIRRTHDGYEAECSVNLGARAARVGGRTFAPLDVVWRS